MNVKVDHMCEMLVISTQVGRQLESGSSRRKREKSGADGCTTTTVAAVTEFSRHSKLKLEGENPHDLILL